MNNMRDAVLPKMFCFYTDEATIRQLIGRVVLKPSNNKMYNEK